VVKAIVDKIKNAEVKADKLVKEAEAKVEQNVVTFTRDREKRLEAVEKENKEIRGKALEEAEAQAKKEEARILDDAQKEMNALRAAADKKKEEAVLLIIRKILDQ
jgi:V/A-type H+-transporting ATPase subunit G/H